LEPARLRAKRYGGSADRRRQRLWRSAEAFREGGSCGGGTGL